MMQVLESDEREKAQLQAPTSRDTRLLSIPLATLNRASEALPNFGLTLDTSVAGGFPGLAGYTDKTPRTMMQEEDALGQRTQPFAERFIQQPGTPQSEVEEDIHQPGTPTSDIEGVLGANTPEDSPIFGPGRDADAPTVPSMLSKPSGRIPDAGTPEDSPVFGPGLDHPPVPRMLASARSIESVFPSDLPVSEDDDENKAITTTAQVPPSRVALFDI